MRPRRGSLAVSIIWGSPIAASNRSAAFAYFIGSLRHESRYSAIDISLWLLASKDRANALNRESLYMTSLRACGRPHLSSVKHRTIPMFPNRVSVLKLLDTRLSCSCNAQRRHCLSYEQAIAHLLGEKLPLRTDFRR